jgi:hypothetical protein
VVCSSILWSHAQVQRPAASSLKALKTEEPIVVDGVISEEIWSKSEPAKDFYQYFPNDTSYSIGKTEVFVTFDDENIYFLAICYDDLPGDYITTSLRRDYRGWSNDGLSIVIDTYQDKTNAFVFGINPFGVLGEGLISNGGQGRDSYSLAWDNKWIGEAKIYQDKWVAEIAIPLKTLRFKDDSKAWNMNFYRIDTKYNERSTWTPMSRNNQIYNLAFQGEVIWEEPLKKPKTNIAVIPYASTSGFKDYEDGDQDVTASFGGDIKLAVTPAMNLDLTFNPDFSQVEVDRQVTNLSRFELFFPERRQFFLENADLFGGFGSRSTRPFFSRRIGITKDTATDQNIQEKIIYGARLSGKITENLRLGFLNMQTDEVENAQPSLNYTVAVLQQKVFSRSNISAIFVNKQDLAYNPNTSGEFHYNRVFGVDYNMASADNQWTGKFYYHRSLDPEKLDQAYTQGANLSYNTRPLLLRWDHVIVGENYNAETGFVPRTGYRKISPVAEIYFYPNSKVINRHGPEIQTDFIWDDGGRKLDHKIDFGYQFNFQNQSFTKITLSQEYTYLTSSFDPTRSDGLELPEGSDYYYTSVRIFYRGDSRRVFNYNFNATAGQYFNGERYSLGGTLNYRFQPYALVSLDAQYNKIKLPKPYNSADLILIGPRLDMTFSKSVFLTGLFQYNNQIDNFNTNIRFQWRFKPVSDLYIVYTDNHYTTDFQTKNRSLVLKLTYWLNL